MSIPGYIICLVLGIAFWTWMATMTVDSNGDKPKIFNRGYWVLFSLLFFIPICNLVLLITEVVLYTILRVCEDLELKDNKFNNFWFNH